jgi:hypothetical protein
MNPLQHFCQHKVTTGSNPAFAHLPTDLLYFIIEYYTQTFQGLYRLREINREWKKLAESSLIWLKCPLVFYCPKEFLAPLAIGAVLTPDQCLEKVKHNQLPGAIIEPRTFQLFIEPPRDDVLRRCSVIIDETKQNRSQLTSVNRTTADRLPEKLSNSFQTANHVYEWFHYTIFVFYNKGWRKRIRYVYRLHSIYNILQDHFTEKIIPFSMYLALFFVITSLYGFYTLQTNMHHHIFAWENYLSFLCLDIVCLIHLNLTILDILNQLSHKFYYSYSLDASFNDPAYYFGNDLIAVSFLTTVIFLIMLQQLLIEKTNSSSSSLPAWFWSNLMIPPWICFTIAVFLIIFHCRLNHFRSGWKTEAMFASLVTASIIFLSACSITLFGLFFDKIGGRVEYPAGYAIIPLLPMVLCFLFIAGFRVLVTVGHLMGKEKIFQVRRSLATTSQYVLNISILISCIFIICCVVVLCAETFYQTSVIPGLSPVFLFALLGFFVHIWIAGEMILNT